MKKVILHPGTRQVQLVSAEILAHSNVTGCTVLDVADDFDLPNSLVDWESLTVGRDPEADMNLVRIERDRRLTDSDKYALPDFPIQQTVRKAWIAYRRALREIPEAQPAATIATVEWPEPPR